MKTQFVLFIALISFCFIRPIAAEDDPLLVKSEIKKATVFLKNAEIERAKSVKVPKGESIIQFTGITEEVLANTIRVTAPKQVNIQSVEFVYHQLDEDAPDSIKIYRKQIETLSKKRDVIKLELEIIKQERAIIEKNQVFVTNETPSLSQLTENTTFIRKQIRSFIEKDNKLKLKDQELATEIQHQYARIRVLSKKIIRPQNGAIKVLVKTEQAVNALFKLHYISPNAGWVPSYDIKFNSLDKPLTISYKAKVYQHTGLAWNNINVAFSSNKPDYNLTAPVLNERHLNYYNNPTTKQEKLIKGKVVDEKGQPIFGVNITTTDANNKFINGVVSDFQGNFSINYSPHAKALKASYIGYETKSYSNPSEQLRIRLRNSQTALQEVMLVEDDVELMEDLEIVDLAQGQAAAASAYRYKKAADQSAKKIRGISKIDAVAHSSNTTMVAVNYELTHPFSLKSTKKPKGIDLAQYEIPASYNYIIIPKAKQQAYLTASFTGWEEMNILPGNSMLFFDGTFVGKSMLQEPDASDTLQIALGVDKDISVERKRVLSKGKKHFLSGKKTETRTWNIIIRNTKSEQINCTVLDQVPVSDLDEIKVEYTELSGAKMNKNTGELKWELILKAKEEKELTISYSVSYPKNKNLFVE